MSPGGTLPYFAGAVLRSAWVARAARASPPTPSIASAGRWRGLHHACRHHQRHRGLDRDVEIDDVAARHVEEEAGGRVGRARHEGRYVLLVGEPRRDIRLAAFDRNTSDHIPGEGNSTSPTRRKVEPLLENSVSKICLRLL